MARVKQFARMQTGGKQLPLKRKPRRRPLTDEGRVRAEKYQDEVDYPADTPKPWWRLEYWNTKLKRVNKMIALADQEVNLAQSEFFKAKANKKANPRAALKYFQTRRVLPAASQLAVLCRHRMIIKQSQAAVEFGECMHPGVGDVTMRSLPQQLCDWYDSEAPPTVQWHTGGELSDTDSFEQDQVQVMEELDYSAKTDSSANTDDDASSSSSSSSS